MINQQCHIWYLIKGKFVEKILVKVSAVKVFKQIFQFVGSNKVYQETHAGKYSPSSCNGSLYQAQQRKIKHRILKTWHIQSALQKFPVQCDTLP